ncbi:MAG TPA: L-rhamnose/proton symporter RhaT [Planctomycetota bacterium]|jgi:L-rhamnose-H+ transport protein
MNPMVTGFALLLLGAVCGGSFGLPSKYAPKEAPWEALWGPFFAFVTILLPVALGPVLVKDFYSIFSTAHADNARAIIMPLVFGFLWGLGSMALGLSFSFLGLSLAYALNYGAQIVFGALAPMAIHTPEKFGTKQGLVTLGGVAVCVLGVIVAGRAGILKEQSMKKDQSAADAASGKPNMMVGLIIGIASGVLCACYGVAASFAGDIYKTAQTPFGNAPWSAAVAQAALILWGGSVSSCLYCVYKLTKNKTWGYFGKPGLGLLLLLALVMAFLHNGAIVFFGLGYNNLDPKIGVSIGYAAFMSFAIIVGNIHGFRAGEWKGASRQSVSLIITGIIILVVGVCILGYGNTLG